MIRNNGNRISTKGEGNSWMGTKSIAIEGLKITYEYFKSLAERSSLSNAIIKILKNTYANF